VSGVAEVRVEGLRKRYSRSGRWVLDGIDATLAGGAVTLVIGGNGAGKTTLLRSVAGASTPSAGRVVRPEGPVGYVPERLPVEGRADRGGVRGVAEPAAGEPARVRRARRDRAAAARTGAAGAAAAADAGAARRRPSVAPGRTAAVLAAETALLSVALVALAIRLTRSRT